MKNRIQIQKIFNRRAFPVAIFIAFSPTVVYAADFEGTLSNLVNAFVGRILPILAVGYLAKNIFGHIQNDPNAKNETVRVVIAIVCLIGISGVWQYVKQQVK
ncbi:hypothetical protein K2X30_13115 [bacterium]|nr:hypothetical protein [bacterium]